MQFCVDSNHISYCNIPDHSIALARWHPLPSLLAQLAVTCAVQHVACHLPTTMLGKSAQAV